jgi:hypothetical protein
MIRTASAFVIAAAASACLAQPTITSLGSGVPLDITNNLSGTYFMGGSSGGARRWQLTGSSLTIVDISSAGGGGQMSSDGQYMVGHWLNDGTGGFPRIFGNVASGSAVPAPFSPSPTLTASTANPPTTDFAARRYEFAGSLWTSVEPLPIVGSLLCFGSSSSGGSGGTFLSGHNMSSDGRYIVGQAYVCTYNNAGTSVSDNSFRWRPFIYDSTTDTTTVLPTPLRTTTNTSLRRTGNAYAVSTDGTVVLGAQEHNVGGTTADSANHAVWRWNGSSYDMTLLNGGAISSTPSSLAMNAAGTIIVGPGTDGTNTFLGKWTWNAGTSTWDGPENLGSNLTTPASWLPLSVTSCGLPPQLTLSIAMNDDASIIVGQARYSTCGSFMSGGFIRHDPGTGFVIEDWYDYNRARMVPGVDTGGAYGPIGDVSGPARGLPRLGYPTCISPDGSATAGAQLGNQIIPGTQPWIIVNSGGSACVAPVIATQPTALTNLSACTSSILFSTFATGTAPFSFQWYKDGFPVVADGVRIPSSTEYLLRINQPLFTTDTGTYTCVVSNACGNATTTNAVVQLDPAFPAVPNDVCATAQVVSMGTNVLGTGQGLCGAYVNDPIHEASCAPGPSFVSKADRWFSFTPSTTGNYRLETCGSNFDTLLSIYDGCGGSQLACNNDYATGPTTGCTASRSRIASVTLNAGTTYTIRIAAPLAAFISGTSLMNLSITNAPASPSNDGCATPTVAVDGPNPYDLVEASNDGVSSCNTAPGRDLWYAYTATATGSVRFDTCGGANFNTVMSIFDSCVGSELACNDNASITGCTNPSLITLPVLYGSTYLVRVGSATSSGVGAGNLNITPAGCDSVDFNNDGVSPDTQDLVDLLSVFGGGPCSTGTCSDIDFNNDGVAPDTSDIDLFLLVFGGGSC